MKNWRNRWFILKERQLYYFKSKESAEAKGRVDLQGVIVEECEERGQRSCFRIIANKEELLVMSAKNDTERTQWINALRISAELSADRFATVGFSQPRNATSNSYHSSSGGLASSFSPMRFSPGSYDSTPLSSTMPANQSPLSSSPEPREMSLSSSSPLDQMVASSYGSPVTQEERVRLRQSVISTLPEHSIASLAATPPRPRRNTHNRRPLIHRALSARLPEDSRVISSPGDLVIEPTQPTLSSSPSSGSPRSQQGSGKHTTAASQLSSPITARPRRFTQALVVRARSELPDRSAGTSPEVSSSPMLDRVRTGSSAAASLEQVMLETRARLEIFLTRINFNLTRIQYSDRVAAAASTSAAAAAPSSSSSSAFAEQTRDGVSSAVAEDELALGTGAERDKADGMMALEQLRTICERMIQATPDSLLENKQCGRLVAMLERIQKRFPAWKEYATMLLFLFAPVSRLVAYIRFDRQRQQQQQQQASTRAMQASRERSHTIATSSSSGPPRPLLTRSDALVTSSASSDKAAGHGEHEQRYATTHLGSSRTPLQLSASTGQASSPSSSERRGGSPAAQAASPLTAEDSLLAGDRLSDSDSLSNSLSDFAIICATQNKPMLRASVMCALALIGGSVGSAFSSTLDHGTIVADISAHEDPEPAAEPVRLPRGSSKSPRSSVGSSTSTSSSSTGGAMRSTAPQSTPSATGRLRRPLSA
eukprot:CAMPEP_0174239262 /NCGR_PEP_ID=MMETSP0417-20130205/14032_1 /TAXON_ID=242541 /ORGANISM="Mayorella sp, Strain BSH-02190019" /LENGTH=710 /DNA_ID=CAMNT_0015318189 /DNA_START=122 /DNA_END=2251 /DNA_ORIENTATION=+